MSSQNKFLEFLKVAIVHEWFVDYSGSERVVEQMLACFPQADLFAQVCSLPPNKRGFLNYKDVTTSFIQNLPFGTKKYRSYLPLMPYAVETFDLSSYDLIISSNHAVAKGVITGPNQLHLCMCYSPMRYAWDLTHQYRRESGIDRGIKGVVSQFLLHNLRNWDVRAANGVDKFIAISEYIARRIEKVYRRESTVIYPPVDTTAFSPGKSRDEFFVTASRFVPYKRINLIVDAFRALPEKRLIVIGDGPVFAKIAATKPENVTLLGFQSHEVLVDHLQRAKAFLFAAEEDFGIAPVEAQACGTPVIAFGRGGASETILDGITGVHFLEQTVESLVDGINRFSLKSFDHEAIRDHALKFSPARFRAEFSEFVEYSWNEFNNRQRKGPLAESVTEVPEDVLPVVKSSDDQLPTDMNGSYRNRWRELVG